ncbi:MAG: pantoate--beta-alanine ligase, partial [Planctomycetota bacterium]|nr:pantoate--beta-alanine ligase [Planctomycetota bacterium]
MTRLISTLKDMAAFALECERDGLSVGFVPTMGALHEGHISLIRKARAENARVVVSIFVNPIQFCAREDFSEYPRNLDGDMKLCSMEKADIVFAPSIAEMYPRGFETYIDQEELPNRMCGLVRPGHFRGVMTVVAKLLNIVRPTVAYFGQKDYQQCAVVKRMAQDLSMNVQVSVEPTVRAQDGLALSSRNQRLGPRQRRDAVCLHKSLQLAAELVRAGKTSVSFVVRKMRTLLLAVRGLKIDYIVFANPGTLVP